MNTERAQRVRSAVWKDIPVDSKVIEVGATDPELGRLLLDMGYTNYHGLVTREKSSDTFHQLGHRLSPCFQTFESPDQIHTNNADVLIFTGYAGCYLFKPMYYRHAQYVVVRTKSFLEAFVVLPLLIHYSLRGGLRLKTWGMERKELGGNQLLITAQIKRPQQSSHQYYINPQMGIKGFFEWLNEENIHYVVLRWFEGLPAGEVDGDIDILVSTEDCDKLRARLSQDVGTIPVDLYSVTGREGTDYQGMAYYPPVLSKSILDKRVLYQEMFYVPSLRHQFLSLAYHAVYHKGLKSGLPAHEQSGVPIQKANHDYGSRLFELSQELGINVEMNLEELARYLKSQDWAPPDDSLPLLPGYNGWNVPPAQVEELDQNAGELIVYILRDYATENRLEGEVIERLKFWGVDILLSMPLSTEAKVAAVAQIRGGNWDTAGAVVAPGGPSYIIVGFDYNPLPLEEVDRFHPLVKNAHFYIKNFIRDYFNPGLPPNEQINFIHSSDTEKMGWDYLAILMPDRMEELRNAIQERREAYQTKEKVVRRIQTYGSHSKTEVIDFYGKKAVKKTYSPMHLRFLEREKFVMREFSQECAAIPPLLDSGHNYIIYPYYEDTFKFNDQRIKCISPKIAKAALDILRFFYNKGYALLDFNARNLLIDRKEGIKVVDFEYLYKYNTVPPTFEGSYDLKGIPDDFDGDAVPGVDPVVLYDKYWKPHIRRPLERLRIRLYLIKIKMKKFFRGVLQVVWHKFKHPARMMVDAVYNFFLKRRFGLPIEE